MDSTPTFSRFDDAYKSRSAPWVIGEIERAGQIPCAVLDVGCGAGEHTILLTCLGYDVLGVDASSAAVEQARGNAANKGVNAHFEVADAMSLGGQTYDTIVDSALFQSSMTSTGRATSPACTCWRRPTKAADSGPKCATAPSVASPE
jgi:SAM-dependent methyltransferase